MFNIGESDQSRDGSEITTPASWGEYGVCCQKKEKLRVGALDPEFYNKLQTEDSAKYFITNRCTQPIHLIRTTNAG